MSGCPPRTLATVYDLGGLLGSGGSADVYAARHRVTGDPVAVKHARRPGSLAAEIELLDRVRHPRTATLLDRGTDEDGTAWYAMTLVPGRPLNRLGGRLSRAQVVDAVAGIADLLDHLRGLGIAHRDVTPSNILVDPHPGGTTADSWLMDFGIAVPQGLPSGPRTGMMVGTASYLSPEQVRGRAASPASDVYALGLVLLEALTGRREYGGTAIEAALARLHRPPDVSALPPDLAALVTETTRQEPGRRPTGAEVAARLRAAHAGPVGRSAAVPADRLTRSAPGRSTDRARSGSTATRPGRPA